MKPYLLLYNLVSCIGWLYVFCLTVQNLFSFSSPAQLWNAVEIPLKIVQTMAALEILHSLLKLVRSPLFTTVLQVSSRLMLVWGYTNSCSISQHHWSLYLMVGSWSMVEIPRYLFYAINLYTNKVPFPIFWLRYSLFFGLYPSGITGELVQVVVSLSYFKVISPVWRVFSYFLLLVYAPAGPFMILAMIKQRNRAFKKRSGGKKKKAPASGLVFPITNIKTGERSTTVTNRRVWSESIKPIDAAEAEKVLREKNWRFKYNKYVVRNVQKSLKSNKACLTVAQAGLTFAHNHFSFVRDGKTMSLTDAMDGRLKGSFSTGFIQGTKPKPDSFQLGIEYKKKILKGEDLVNQLNKWSTYGTIEPTARDAIKAVVDHPEWLDLSDRYFVLLGATSAMGPLLVLLEHGANIIAIDLDRQHIWERLFKLVRNSCGTMTFPLKKSTSELSEDQWAAHAGCNLFTQTPEIKNWLVEVEPDKAVTVGSYAYLDGALHVQVSLAMDAVVKGLIQERKNVSLAYLCSPTDCFVIPDHAFKGAQRNFNNAPSIQKILSSAGILAENSIPKDEGIQHNICDGLVVAQGPNYSLAKRIQHWRAMIARESGATVSSNIAPSTSTASVVSNKSFAAAYGGMHHFIPMEVMRQETSNGVMGALLIHDIQNENGIAYPKTKVQSQLELFSSGAFHGGIWQCGFKIDTIGVPSAVSFYLKEYGHIMATVMAGLVGFTAMLLQDILPLP